MVLMVMRCVVVWPSGRLKWTRLLRVVCVAVFVAHKVVTSAGCHWRTVLGV